jgi:hypothetical protein
MRASGDFRNISCDKQIIRRVYISAVLGARRKIAKIGDISFAMFECPAVAT